MIIMHVAAQMSTTIDDHDLASGFVQKSGDRAAGQACPHYQVVN